MANTASVTAPGAPRVRTAKSAAAAAAMPASTSTAISTVVSGPSWRPPWPSSASAARSVPNATVVSVRALRPGTATARPPIRMSAEAAGDDTVPADRGGREQRDERERREEHDNGSGKLRRGRGHVADGADGGQRLRGGGARRGGGAGGGGGAAGACVGGAVGGAVLGRRARRGLGERRLARGALAAGVDVLGAALPDEPFPPPEPLLVAGGAGVLLPLLPL